MPGPVSAPPDVTVVLPVYNTMPYLTACLRSLVAQTIGLDRMEVVAVDDGSTDGSGEELERFAAEHPELFRVLHQENSGGPAGPCNRALTLARGRYVFFLGADDYLADYALERMVDRADEWGSDVVMGRIEGVGGRRGQTRFDRDEPDVAFPHSQLPFALGNSKLFRRSLLEEHGIRYPEDLRVGSDQPFTIEAMLHARRISVLAAEPYYYGIRRDDSSNITFSSTWRARLRDIGTVMDHVADLVALGEDRDQILHRHFAWEVGNRLRLDLLHLPEDEQRALCARVAELADRYLTDGVSRRLPVGARARIRLAQAGRLDELRAVVQAQEQGARSPVAVRDGAFVLALPGCDAWPVDWCEPRPEELLGRLDGGVRVTRLAWCGTELTLEARTPLHPNAASRLGLELRPQEGPAVASGEVRAGGPDVGKTPASARAVLALDGGSRLTATIDVAPLLDGRLQGPSWWAPRLVLGAGSHVVDLPLTAARAVPTRTATPVEVVGAPGRLVARVGAHRRLVLVHRPLDRATPGPAGSIVSPAAGLRRLVRRIRPG